MKWIWSLAVAAIMLLSASMIAFDHENPNNSLNIFNLQTATLSNSPSSTLPLYSSGGLYNLSGVNFGSITLYMEPVGGTYQYDGKPYIASAFTSDGTSTTFNVLFNATVNWNAVTAGSFSSQLPTLYVTVSTTAVIQGVNTQFSFGSQTFSTTFPTSQTYFTQKLAVNSALVNAKTFTGAYNSLVTFTTAVSVTATNESNFYGYLGASFHNEQVTLSRQVLILPSTAQLQQPQSPIKQGTIETITYTTGFAPINPSGNGYYLIIAGSPAYNGGQVVANISLKDNVINGQYAFQVPSNAFVPTTQVNGNQWSVVLADNNFGLVYKEFFTIDHYSYEPPAPTITITNPPAGGQFVYGQTVDVTVHAPMNTNSSTPIQYVDIWVYSGISQSSPAMYVYNDVPMTVVNGNVTFSFQMPNSPNNLYIQAESVDQYGRASQITIMEISSYDIHSPNATAPSGALATIIIAVVASIVGTFLLFITPIDTLSKGILISAWIASVLIIFNAYLPGIL